MAIECLRGHRFALGASGREVRSILRKSLFGAGLDAGLKTAGMTEADTGGIVGQPPSAYLQQ